MLCGCLTQQQKISFQPRRENFFGVGWGGGGGGAVGNPEYSSKKTESKCHWQRIRNPVPGIRNLPIARSLGSRMYQQPCIMVPLFNATVGKFFLYLTLLEFPMNLDWTMVLNFAKAITGSSNYWEIIRDFVYRASLCTASMNHAFKFNDFPNLKNSYIEIRRFSMTWTKQVGQREDFIECE